MLGRLIVVMVVTGLFAVGVELLIRRNRAERVRRSHLAEHGIAVVGTVRSLHTISAGRHASEGVRALITFSSADGAPNSGSITVQWTSHEARGHPVGSTLELLVNPLDLADATVAGGAAPRIIADAALRSLVAVVFVVCLVAALSA